MLKPKYKMYQEVVLVRKSLEDDFFGEPVTVKKGQTGVIVLINIATDVPYVGYEVEFFDDKDETIAVSTVKEEDISALPDDSPDMKVAKRRKNKSKSRAA